MLFCLRKIRLLTCYVFVAWGGGHVDKGSEYGHPLVPMGVAGSSQQVQCNDNPFQQQGDLYAIR